PAAAGDDGEVDLGEAQARVGGGDADVAGQRQLEAAAEGVAADGGDDRLRAALHQGAELHAPAVLAEDRRHLGRGELADVGAGGERLVAGADHHDDADAVVGDQPLEGGIEVAPHGLVHRVVNLGPVERDGADAVGRLPADRLVLVTHRTTFFARSPA